VSILNRLKELGYDLPPPPKPAASYKTVVTQAGFVFVSGQGPMVGPNPVITGRVGESVTEEQAYEAARLAILNALAAIHAEIGLDNISRIVRLTGWVSSTQNFFRQHLVLDGASDLLIAVFGDAGLHTRCALGVNVLPFNIPVEVELTAALL
jgi:enamine deaminase RidA (YjgF/YER057c/UK114 family)